ncbi:MAG TPA: TolC family protein [Bryobacteraceae bacterium]|nr:TolC family protein [Bryobacteraceae bacterium]
MRPASVRRSLVACICVASLCAAQDSQYSIERPHLPVPLRSYAPATVSTSRPGNSKRLHELLRAGRLYLTVQDALALAIENNLNLEVDRYGPLLAQTALERSKAGGPLRGVPSASAQVASVDAGVGVNGSVQSAGLSSGGGGTSSVNAGGAVIQQVGQVTPNLDPVLQNATTFAHLSQPQPYFVVSQTSALIQTLHVYNTTLQEGLLSGGYVQLRSFEEYLKENAPSDNLNPAVGPFMSLAIRHNLLQGFGVKLNNRGIRIAEINTVASRETFRSQLLDLTASVLNLYWDLVSGNDELKVRRSALEMTQKFLADTQKEIAAGALPRVELPRAEAEASSRTQDVVVAEYNVRERENALKDAITRAPDPEIEAAPIVTLDSIQVPDSDDLPPLRQLVATALEKRPDVAVSKYRDQTQEMNLIGTENPLLPSLVAQGLTYNRGAAGTPQIVNGAGPNPYFVGGYGTALKQILRRDFPNETGSLGLSIPVGNRLAQGDYGIDQLQFRQSQVSGQRDTNQIVVDISNQLSAVRQSRARFATAKNTRMLQEQLLADERKKFSYGISTFNDIIVDQRALVTAQVSEVTASITYARARVSLDQVLGETLEKNNISLAEGLSGHVSH